MQLDAWQECTLVDLYYLAVTIIVLPRINMTYIRANNLTVFVFKIYLTGMVWYIFWETRCNSELSLNLLPSVLDDESATCWVVESFNRSPIQSKGSSWFLSRSKMQRWTCRRCRSRYRKPADPRSQCSFCKSLRLQINILFIYMYLSIYY